MGLAGDRGRAAEVMAASYFELIGCDIVARNVRLDDVEVDLVVREGRQRVVVEVKARTRDDFGGAALAVDHRKRSRLLRAASALLRSPGGPVRIDVVAIDVTGSGAKIEHYRAAVTY
jgi:putative endonuclease